MEEGDEEEKGSRDSATCVLVSVASGLSMRACLGLPGGEGRKGGREEG